MPCPSHSSWFDRSIGWGVMIMNFLAEITKLIQLKFGFQFLRYKCPVNLILGRRIRYNTYEIKWSITRWTLESLGYSVSCWIKQIFVEMFSHTKIWFTKCLSLSHIYGVCSSLKHKLCRSNVHNLHYIYTKNVIFEYDEHNTS